MKPKSARELSLLALYAVDKEEAYSNLVLHQILEEYRPAKVDRGFITELVYGTLRTLNTLDWVLGQFLKKPLSDLTPWIRNILRMGVYQLMFLDKVPSAAAVNEGVNLAKKYGHPGTVKLVNGVLRSIVRNLGGISFPDLAEDPVSHIALKYSHPSWLVERWLTDFGLEGTISLCRANNRIPPNTVRANTLKTTREQLARALATEGVAAEECLYAPEGLHLKGFTSIASLQAYRAGLFQVQDESSMLAGHALKPAKGSLVLEACAAPGGKATHLAQLMENTGKIIANDVHEHKLALIRENCRRLGITNLEADVGDARELPAKFAGQIDYCLVDAPCSGLGVLRRKPEVRWRKEPGQIKELQQLQLAILKAGAQCLKPGGVLVYSTCTITREENQEVVEEFLRQHPDFVPEDLTPFLPMLAGEAFSEPAGDQEPPGGRTGPSGAVREQGYPGGAGSLPGALQTMSRGYVQLLPHLHGTDGFFIARLVKKQGRN